MTKTVLGSCVRGTLIFPLNRKSGICSFVLVATLVSYMLLNYSLLAKYSGTKYGKDAYSSHHNLRGGPPCVIPKLHPLPAAIKKFMLPPQYLNCSAKSHPLMFSTDLDSTIIVVRDPKDYGFEDCCYTPFTRDESDRDQKYSSHCYAIGPNTTKVPPPREFIAIYCRQSRFDWSFMNTLNWLLGKKTLVDMLHFVHMKPEVESRMGSNSLHKPAVAENAQTPNIVILGLDSVSHMNFIRMMPKSHAYLRKNLSAIEMNGYSLFEENTFANIVPMFTGLSTEELKHVCWKSKSDHFDNCPFLWKNFSQQGYRTFYAEDSTWLGIFLYEKSGFKEQPTDYYLVPLLDAFDNKKMGTDGNSSIRTNLCYGPRQGISILLNNIQKVMYRMGNSRKYFQFTWVTSLAHENHNFASSGDDELRSFMEWMNVGKYLTNTIFVLLSDHGARFGPFRETEQGRLEARMPFLYFVFPEWFSQKYNAAMSNVKLNQGRLTTPLDMHETLKDLLNLTQIDNHAILKRSQDLKNSSTIPRAISLFLEQPNAGKRSCHDAEIELHACACKPPPSMAVNNNKVVKSANESVNIINKMLESHRGCAVLSLDKVINAYEVFDSNKYLNTTTVTVSKSYDESVTFVIMIIFKTSPSDAIFEATLIEADNKWTTSGQISRINKYGDQSRCVADYRLKPYCYCI